MRKLTWVPHWQHSSLLKGGVSPSDGRPIRTMRFRAAIDDRPHPQASARPFLSSLCWHSARTGVYGLLGYAAYELLGLKYRFYMRNSYLYDALNYDPGLEGLSEDISDNFERLDRERGSRQDKMG